MNVLSLFDGISCGMAAFERAGIFVDNYYAYEIDKYAIDVSHKNYPQIHQCGDVTTADFKQYRGKIDIVIGGSPCTYWSIAKNNREITPDGIGGQLFMHFVRAVRESDAKYFLYENNFSIHKNIKSFISRQLGVEPIMINSALVSAQNRKRCYWTNIPDIEQPADRGIMLSDVIETGVQMTEKAYCMTATYNGATVINTLERHQRTMIANPVRIGTAEHGGDYSNDSQAWRIYSPYAKSATVCGQGGGAGAKTGLYAVPGVYGERDSKTRPVYTVKNGMININGKQFPIKIPDGCYIIRKLTPIETERLQTLPDNYTSGISNTQRYKCIGNGWTVDVIAHILSYLKK